MTTAEAMEVAATFERLRAEAAALFVRAGWGTEEDFARDVPPLGLGEGAYVPATGR